MNKNYAGFEVQAGITYHFKNSNGTHHFTIVKPYDQAEVDALNAQINDLRAQNDACNANLRTWKDAAARLQKELDA